MTLKFGYFSCLYDNCFPRPEILAWVCEDLYGLVRKRIMQRRILGGTIFVCNPARQLQHHLNCWMMLHSVERDGQRVATCNTWHSRVWDQNASRNLRRQTRAILVCPQKGARLIDLRLGPSSRFSWSVSFTYFLPFLFLLEALVVDRFKTLFVRSPYCSLNTHSAILRSKYKV